GPAGEGERAAADGVARELIDADRLDVVPGDDLEVHQRLLEEALRERLAVVQAHGVVVDGLDAVDGAEQARSRARLAADAALGEDALEREHDVLGREGLAVVERHALDKLELEREVVGKEGRSRGWAEEQKKKKTEG